MFTHGTRGVPPEIQIIDKDPQGEGWSKVDKRRSFVPLFQRPLVLPILLPPPH